MDKAEFVLGAIYTIDAAAAECIWEGILSVRTYYVTLVIKIGTRSRISLRLGSAHGMTSAAIIGTADFAIAAGFNITGIH